MHKKILKIVLQVLPFIFFAFALFLILQVVLALKNDRTPSVFGYSIFLILTPSMEDTIMTGDLIFVDINTTEYEEGDIITFYNPENPNMTITHRIITITDDNGTLLYTTKGDNNNSSGSFETEFTDEYIIGKYVSKSSFFGKIYQFIFTGGINLIYGTVVLVFVLIGVTEVSHLIKTVGQHRKELLEKEKEKMIEEEKARLRKEYADKNQSEE
ncbi:MAG: signal peptidase I [Firmicutes bacterium]|nr:signal peptidase I [Bacillota bacterium]